LQQKRQKARPDPFWSFLSKLPRTLRGHDDETASPYDLHFGDALLKEKVITDGQLTSALEQQTAILKREGRLVRLGEMIVSLGFATEEDIVRGINRHYRISAKSLSDNIEELITKSRLTSREKMSFFTLPIMIKLTVAVLFIVGLTILSLSYFMLERQKDRLYRQTIQMGKMSLTYFTNNAKIPLINDDILTLNSLIKESASVEGITYALIIDTDGTIKAHTDFTRIGTPYTPPDMSTGISKERDLIYFRYTDTSDSELLDLSRPVTFKNIQLGEVHLGISLAVIEDQIRQERSFIIILGCFMAILGIILAAALGINFSRPIAKLASATQEIAQGNLDHIVRLPRKDEFGNLALAFNYMTYELKMKSRLQETFGRYVSPAILKMIMANPDKTWLKGTRNEASVLFTDIRGFTAYSEKTEPEKIVEDLNEYFAIATKHILAHGGYVDKFIGDAVLGVFGIPIPQENHAEMAVKAAVAMQRELQETGKHGNELLSVIGIAVNSGVVVSGNLGSQVRMEYSIIGDSVNVASRLNELAGPGEVIISRSVFEATRDIVTVEVLPPQKLKGKTGHIDCFNVVDLAPKDGNETGGDT